MIKSPLNYKTAALLSLGICLLINILFIIMFLYGKDSVVPPDGERIRPNFNLHITFIYALFNFITAFTIYMVNFYLLNKKYLSKRNWLIIVPAVIIVTVIISLLFSYLSISIEDRPFHARVYWGALFRDLFIATVVTLSSQLLYVSHKQQQTLIENETLLVENIRSRFQALKSQVDPHFLFNSLNTLNSLIAIDKDKAQEYVQQLSNVFRYTLQTKEKITLEEELKFNYSYCHLMQIRYGDNLKFVYDIDEKFYAYSIIPLTIQALVENAIKHNVVSNKQPLTIKIITKSDGLLSVSNRIQPKKELERGEGIGLVNLRERYKLMYKSEIEVNNTEEEFEVVVPLLID
ncbi:two-component system LytT family sensor kinase [Dysgonomonadaceae bacterium PH5-43]|nr:two-component system LytT family sensor kinase [Dysgonomonadaceae bacterium PH5-43]